MNWPARPPGVVVNPRTPMLLEKPMTPTDVFEVPITPCCWFDVPTTPAMFEVLGTGGPCTSETPLTPVSAPDRLSMPGPKKETARIAVPVNERHWHPSFCLHHPVKPGDVTAAP